MVVIDIDYGLLMGIIFSLFVLLAKNQSALVSKLGRIAGTDLYLEINEYPEAKEISGMVLFRIVGAIHFANREAIKKTLFKQTSSIRNNLNVTKKTELEMISQQVSCNNENKGKP